MALSWELTGAFARFYSFPGIPIRLDISSPNSYAVFCFIKRAPRLS
jgi:hypothetical protein